MMKKIVLSLAVAGSLGTVGCAQGTGPTNQEARNTAIGAGAGAIAGQLLGGDTESTIAGAVVGGAGAFLVTNARRNDRGQCLYEDRSTGKRFYADCR